MSSNPVNIAWALLLLTWSWPDVLVAAPSSQELGAILGYPAGEIIVEDTTTEEREIWSTPTLKERKASSLLPSPQALIRAYKIVGKDPKTFFPMRIWFAREGSFLNPQVRQLLAAIATDPSIPVARGGKGPFGPKLFGELGEGGIFLGKVKVASSIKEMTQPQEKIAMVSVLNLASLHIDVKIAFMAALEGAPELHPLPGGEKYFEAFGPTEGDRSESNYDVAGLFQSLNQLVAAEQLAPPREPTESGSPQRPSNRSIPQRSIIWIWIAIAAVVGCLAVIYKKIR